MLTPQPAASSPKRQRTAHACFPCRRRKAKCGGELPACSSCIASRRDCIYDDGTRKRGLQPGYVRGLETLLGLYLHAAPRAEHDIRTFLRSEQTRNDWVERVFGDGRVQVWRMSGLSADLDRLLLNWKEPPTAAAEILPPIASPSEANESSQYGLADFDADQQRQMGAGARVSLGGFSEDTRMSPFPAQTADMVDFYFTYFHCWLPILERRNILRIVHCEDQPSTLGNTDRGLRACVWAILALTRARARDRFGSRDIPNLDEILARLHGETYQHRQEPALEHAQAILLTAMLRFIWGQLRVAWSIVGMAARILATLQDRPSRYAHTVRGCLVLDNFLSTLLGISPSYHAEIFEHTEKLDEDAIEEWELWPPPSDRSELAPTKKRPLRTLSSFNLTSQLIERLSKIMSHSIDLATQRAWLSDLQSWRAKLPQNHQLQESSSRSPPLLNLHLMWSFVTLVLLAKIESNDDETQHLTRKIMQLTLDLVKESSTEPHLACPLLLGHLMQVRIGLKRMARAHALAGIGDVMDGSTDLSLSDIDGLQEALLEHWRCDIQIPDKTFGASATEQPFHTLATVESALRSSQDDFSARTIQAFPFSSSSETPRNLYKNGSRPLLSTGPHGDQPIDSHLETGTSGSFTIPIEDDYDREIATNSRADQLSDGIVFDTLFDEMSSFVPVRSHSYQPNLAQNLGFMGDTLDPDLFASLRPPLV